MTNSFVKQLKLVSCNFSPAPHSHNYNFAGLYLVPTLRVGTPYFQGICPPLSAFIRDDLNHCEEERSDDVAIPKPALQNLLHLLILGLLGPLCYNHI